MPWTRTGEFDPLQEEIQSVLCRHAGAVIGKGCFISPDAHIFTRRLSLGAKSWIAGGVIIRGDVSIGENSTVNAFSQIAGKVTVGDGVRIASNVAIFGFNHGFSRTDTPIYKQGVTIAGIEIGDGVWVGANAVIVDGCTIGAHTIVAAGSVVTKSFGDYLIIGGNPARQIRNRLETGNQT